MRGNHLGYHQVHSVHSGRSACPRKKTHTETVRVTGAAKGQWRQLGTNSKGCSQRVKWTTRDGVGEVTHRREKVAVGDGGCSQSERGC